MFGKKVEQEEKKEVENPGKSCIELWEENLILIEDTCDFYGERQNLI